MKSIAVIISLASSISLVGCRTEKVLVGGDRVMHFAAGVAVPSVSAEANTEGFYLLTDSEMDAIVNP